jgi:hypothetical protein
MGKMGVFTFLLLVLGAPVALGDEVISIDINNYGNKVAYSGTAGVAGAATWIAYDGGWGVPVGSGRTSGLAEVGEVKAGTYAAQVWMADDGQHNYVSGAGAGLLDDGFVSRTPSPTATSSDPNLLFVGIENAGDVGAYGDVFDVYVYGDSAGTFRLTDANMVPLAAAESVSGTVAGFVEGQNYVVFEDIAIANPNSVRLLYSNEINAIQLVKTTTPKSIIRHTMTADPNDYTINVPAYSAAYDTNGRAGEITFYGPDISADEVYYLDTNEFMEYDIQIDALNKGKYNFYVDLTGTMAVTVEVFLDGALRGTVTGTGTRVGPVGLNLFEGTHIIKWRSTGAHGGNIDDLVFNYVGAISFADCQEVKSYGIAPAGDVTGDCRVSLADLVAVAADWALCYDPVNCD